MTVTFDKWRTSQKYLRIQHNKRVTRWFRSESNTSTTRTNLRNSLLIYPKDSASQITAKITYFNSIKLEYLDFQVPSFVNEWHLKATPGIPQLAIIYRTKDKRSKSGNFITHLPHYKGNKKPRFIDFTKGNYWARIVLKDNTQIRINAQTESKAITVAKGLLKYVDNRFKTDDIATGKYAKERFKEIRVKPVRADYYARGNEQNYPTWQHFFKYN